MPAGGGGGGGPHHGAGQQHGQAGEDPILTVTDLTGTEPLSQVYRFLDRNFISY